MIVSPTLEMTRRAFAVSKTNPMRITALVVLFLLCSQAGTVSGQGDASADATTTRPLSVWLPAPLIADTGSAAYEFLLSHTETFANNNGVTVQYRIKDVGAVGGIMSSIRSGSEVAPGSLPDIALLPSSEFSPTTARQYLQSMETLFSSSLINDLDNALEMGQILLEGSTALFGLPYFLELLHAVYAIALPGVDDGLSFDDVLISDATLILPAARPTGLNQSVFLQYLTAGGSLTRDGNLVVDEEALRALLQFYQSLTQQDRVAAEVLTYQSPAAYQSRYIELAADGRIGVFWSNEFLAMRDQALPSAKPVNIPTLNGDSLATRRGWLWVILTPDGRRQTLSARFLEWMTEPEFHAAFAQLLYQLPTQSAILEESLPNPLDHDFYAELAASAIPQMPESEGGTVPRILQEAFAQVLRGEATAASATRQVVNQFASR